MVSAATARATKGEGSAVVVKCFADEVMQQMQKEAARHPFQELQVQKPCLLLHPVNPKEKTVDCKSHQPSLLKTYSQ